MTTTATVICDASFHDETRAAGWAAWINVNHPNGKHIRIKKGGRFNALPVTSTQAEEWACYNGIWLAYQNGARKILVQTDCQSLVHKRTADYEQNKRQHWPDAEIEWRHVKGHNLHIKNDARTFCNDWCDRVAKQYMREMRQFLWGAKRKKKRKKRSRRLPS